MMLVYGLELGLKTVLGQAADASDCRELGAEHGVPNLEPVEERVIQIKNAKRYSFLHVARGRFPMIRQLRRRRPN